MHEDARVLELTWLAEFEQGSKKHVGPLEGDTPERRLVVHLLAHGFVEPSVVDSHGISGRRIQRDFEDARWNAIGDLMHGEAVDLVISHAGAVRRAELEQQLQSSRLKEPMELIWDGRHFRQDTRIALLYVTNEHPLVVAYLDLNDVKAFNDMGHSIGDDAIRRYLQVVADIAESSGGDAYRLSGGADEVVVLLPELDLDQGVEIVRTLLEALGREKTGGLSLRAAAGVIQISVPEGVDEIKNRADLEQQRAKTKSRESAGRPSVLAFSPNGLEVVSPG